MKYLIINADDFGYSKIFNSEILRLLKHGLVSSTTVLVDWISDAQDAQVKELIDLKHSLNISVGLHLAFNDTNFLPEIKRQQEKFNLIFGFEPSHLDLHKSTYLKEVADIIATYCNEKKLPSRNHKVAIIKPAYTTTEVLNGSNMSFEELKGLIEHLKDGVSYEILFHPGKYDSGCKSSLNKQREDDVRKIEAINSLLKENSIKLISFYDLA